MNKEQLYQIASYLAELLEIDLNEQVDPIEPLIIIKALAIIFPDKQEQLEGILSNQSIEEQWNTALEFIEINMLNNQAIEMQSLGIEEICQIYGLVIQYAEQTIEKFQESNVDQDQINKVLDEERKKQRKEQNNMHQLSLKGENLNKKQQKQGKKIQQKRTSKSKSKSKEKIKAKPSSKPKPKIIKPQQKPKIIQSKARPAQRQAKKSSIQKKEDKIKKAIKEDVLENQLLKEITSVMTKAKKNNPKTNALLRDQVNNQQVKKTRRQFDYYLKQFKRDGRMKNKQKKRLKLREQNKKNGVIDNYYLKVLQKKQRNAQEIIINQQLRYFLSLRDKKVAFINQIHRLTQKLQRQRQIEWQKSQKQMMRKEKDKVKMKIQESNALFQKNMEMLKENYKLTKHKNELQNYNERVIGKQMQECMIKKKSSQLQNMKTLWQQQNLKLNNIMGDQVKLKDKLIDLYRKNRP